VTFIDGFDGTYWNLNAAKVTFYPVQRTTPDGARLRYILSKQEDDIESKYTLIRLSGTEEVYLVGRGNVDVKENKYSVCTLLRRGYYACQIFTYEKPVAASGFAMAAIRTLSGTTYADIDSNSAVDLKQPNTATSDSVIILPRGTVVSSVHELQVDGAIYDIREVHKNNGLIYARTYVKTHV
jgi:hypothetical protein